MLGYAGTAVIVLYTSWKYAFWGQSALLIVLFFIYLSFPTKYYIEKSKLEEKMIQLNKMDSPSKKRRNLEDEVESETSVSPVKI